MDELGKIEFKVDEEYKNEKGVFRVISIHREQMVIRWEDGEEIQTDIELQHRIAERRQREKQKPPAAIKAMDKPVFAGFLPTDFKKSAAGTIWRSRNQLGEAVTQKIGTTQFKFKSWAFSNKSEMHVQDIKQHRQETIDYQAKFVVRVDQQALHYGFRVERSANRDALSTNWEAFNRWLAQQGNEQMLHAIAFKENLTVCNLTTPSSGILSASDEGWSVNDNGQQSGKETVAVYINDTQESEPFDLEIAATIDKDDAVACGSKIIANIAQLFTQLLPLYQGAVAH
jgi:hypothetical protein